jgi:benzoylsuccinyl-CoA thiolase BbsB subunit
VTGIGMTPFRKKHDVTQAELGQQAVVAALRDAEFDKSKVEAVFSGSGYGGPMLGQRILRDLGMTGVPIVNNENACSSGSTALHLAFRSVALGMYDAVLVIGSDKLSRFGSGTIPLEDDDHEVRLGQIMPAVYAMRAQRYLHEFGGTPADLALVSVKNRKHASLNEYAQLRDPLTVEEVVASRPVAEPLTLLMACPKADGAAALLITSERYKQSRSVELRASILTSGIFVDGIEDTTIDEITVRCAKETYETVGFGPEEVDVAEVHDAFASAEVFYYEALGFCKQGEGLELLRSGATAIGGRIPVNPSGGLLSKGHPVGATGVAQIVEIVEQLRGEAGARQVEGAKVGLTHCTGGGIAGMDHGACTIHVLVR